MNDRRITPGDVLRLLRMRKGHFALESGHHGNLWIDLEALCLEPEPVRRCAEALADRLRPHEIEAVCGPLVEGAFVALFVASTLRVPFTYSIPERDRESGGLYRMRYRVPAVLRRELLGKRVAIVNDVVNAGSAIQGTLTDLLECGTEPVAIGTLATLGDMASVFARDQGLALETLASQPNEVWKPEECPLCAAGAPLMGAGA
jgi:orotate phosphoribosyltransferase